MAARPTTSSARTCRRWSSATCGSCWQRRTNERRAGGLGYMRFEHGEDVPSQDEAVRLFTALEAASPDVTGMVDYALRHRAIVQRFGRFPHRNAALGRASTAEGIEFLKQPGSSF